MFAFICGLTGPDYISFLAHYTFTFKAKIVDTADINETIFGCRII